MGVPSFFIVGHPRSGSGYLDSLLKAHPHLFVARKELHFFGSDLGYNRPARTEANYLAHFAKARPGQRAGEASTWYLYSETAAAEMHAFAPEARILVLLREPVGWLASLHSHFRFTGDEPCPTLGEALAQPPEIRQQHDAHSTQPTGALFYRRLVQYADQVRRYYDLFGRDRVQVILLDDLFQDPEEVLTSTLTMLGVDPDFPGRAAALEGTRRARNANRTVYSARLRRFLRSPANLAVLRGLTDPPVVGWDWLLRGLHRLNLRYGPRPPLDPALRHELTRAFAPEMARTGALIERDLHRWTSVPTAVSTVSPGRHTASDDPA